MSNKTEQTYVEHFKKELSEHGVTERDVIVEMSLDPMQHYREIDYENLSISKADEILRLIRNRNTKKSKENHISTK